MHHARLQVIRAYTFLNSNLLDVFELYNHTAAIGVIEP